MSHSVTISDSVLSVAALLRTGDLRAVRAQWRETLRCADEIERAALAECGWILKYRPRNAIVHLRAAWRDADDERTRAVIEACAPRPGEHRAQATAPDTESGPRWDRRAIEQARAQRRAGGRVTTRTDADQRRTREEARASARSRTTHRAVNEYTATRAGVDDVPQRSAQPDGYAVDYERMAVQPVARDRDRPDPRATAVRDGGRPCVALGCNVIPSVADRAHRDGLCEECRELDRPGIEVADGAGRAQMIAALCAYIWENYPKPMEHLRREWHRAATEADRATVAEWVTAHAAPAAEQPAAPGLTRCATCGDERGPRDLRHQDADDGQCAQCRALLAEAAPSAADEEPAALVA